MSATLDNPVNYRSAGDDRKRWSRTLASALLLGLPLGVTISASGFETAASDLFKSPVATGAVNSVGSSSIGYDCATQAKVSDQVSASAHYSDSAGLPDESHHFALEFQYATLSAPSALGFAQSAMLGAHGQFWFDLGSAIELPASKPPLSHIDTPSRQSELLRLGHLIAISSRRHELSTPVFKSQELSDQSAATRLQPVLLEPLHLDVWRTTGYPIETSVEQCAAVDQVTVGGATLQRFDFGRLVDPAIYSVCTLS
ncbi:MAG: hypothetical protein O3B26_04980 [Proteobacteria bacterium]|nr:hypothetical protein [Pseudomonadota bacterium]